MKPGIEAYGLHKSYGSQRAVDGLDLRISPGEIYGLLGPNGAGKTTTLKLLAGLLAPDQGEIVIAGYHLSADPIKAKALIGFIPDNPFVYHSLTGREFMGLVAGLYQVDPSIFRARLEELSELLEIGPWLDQRTEGYSHGMRQKLVLASALLHRPAVLLIDEPLVGLDPASIQTVREIFRRQAAEGAALLISTHTLSLAEAVCHRIGIISQGRMLVQGTLAVWRSGRRALLGLWPHALAGLALGTLEEIRRLSQRRHTDLERLYLEFTRPSGPSGGQAVPGQSPVVPHRTTMRK